MDAEQREQVRRDAEQMEAARISGLHLGVGLIERVTDALPVLLAELEQAERTRDSVWLANTKHIEQLHDLNRKQGEEINRLEARLAAVPALVEAAREYAAHSCVIGARKAHANLIVAIAAYEQAQEIVGE